MTDQKNKLYKFNQNIKIINKKMKVLQTRNVGLKLAKKKLCIVC